MPDGATLAHARELVSQRNYQAAQQILHESMGRARQDPGQASFAEAEAAVLYAGVLLQLSDAATAGNWATYGYTAMRRLHGERDHRTLHALGVLAATRHREGALDLASRHYQQLVAALSAVDGPDSERTLAAKADAAGVDHALGRCSEARASLAQVIEAHRLSHGPAHPVGLRMTARLAVMWRDCGDYERARDLVTQARSRAKALVPTDETHLLLDAASTAAADKDHRCGMTPMGGGPFPLVVMPRAVVLPRAVLVPSAQDVLPSRPRNGTVDPHITEWPEDDIAEPASVGYGPAPPIPPPPASSAPPAPPPLLPAPVEVPPEVVVRDDRPNRLPHPAIRTTLGVIAFGCVAAVAVALVAVALLATG
jgi:hypothetical protein